MAAQTLTAFKAAGELITSAVALAAIIAAAMPAAGALTPQKRVGIDWEHRQFMPRDERGPIVPETPSGPVWYVEPPARRT
jgi:hypothetical protein